MGSDLAERRLAFRLRQQDVALVMGVSRGRVSGIEAQAWPTYATVCRFLDAVSDAAEAAEAALPRSGSMAPPVDDGDDQR